MMAQADTLVCDTARVDFWRSQPAYDYNRELVAPEADVHISLLRGLLIISFKLI